MANSEKGLDLNPTAAEYEALISVVINRVWRTGSTIHNIIFAPNQFQGVNGPAFTSVVKDPSTNTMAVWAAVSVLTLGVTTEATAFLVYPTPPHARSKTRR